MAEINEFDIKASEWDKNPVHHERSVAIAREMLSTLQLSKELRAMEFGAGTGILSFLLKDHLKEILLIDSSNEMLNITNKKIKEAGITNMSTKLLDLEQNDYTGKPFDVIFTQMVLHHVANVESLLIKFHDLLVTGGKIAIADLYTEDGSFHGDGFNGHKGFDVDELASLLVKCGFDTVAHNKCFVIERKISDEITKSYPVFLITANRL